MHPGEVLREEFLAPLKLSAGALARKMDVPRTRIERIAEEKTGVTADTALRLSKVLGTTPQLWLNLQTDYDLQMALRALGKKLAKIEPVADAKRACSKLRILTEGCFKVFPPRIGSTTFWCRRPMGWRMR